MASSSHGFPPCAPAAPRARLRSSSARRGDRSPRPRPRQSPDPSRTRDAGTPPDPAEAIGPAEPVEVTLHGIAHGGEAVGRLPDGRACFVPFALPGERALVRIVEQRKRFARAELLEVLDAAPERAVPPCPYFGPGRCGGCQLQHATPKAQAGLKERILREQLQRIGKVDHPPVASIVSVSPAGYRSTARFAVDARGRLGFRRAGSHEVQPVDRCLLLDAPTQALRDMAGDRWEGAEEVVVRTGTSGDGLLVVRPGAQGPAETAGLTEPGTSVLLTPPGGDPGTSVVLTPPEGEPHVLHGDGAVTVAVDGFDLRVSATSFFQTGPQGAALLLRLVREAAAVRPGDAVLELFAGVGLFTRGLVADGAVVTAVESDPSATADMAHNLSGTAAEVVRGDAARHVAAAVTAAEHFDVVVLDPPRRGAGTQLAADLARLGPRTIVYVACDPAALARDTRALLDAGYDLEQVVPVDQFPQTAAIEAVATFRGPGSQP